MFQQVRGPWTYRSSPVTIEAIQYIDNASIKEIEDWGAFIQRSLESMEAGFIQVWNSLEKQWINCPRGHFVIKGTKGEFYPCDPNVMYDKYIRLGEANVSSD